MTKEGDILKRAGEPFELGPYRPLGKGEVVDKTHIEHMPPQEGKAPEPYVPVRVYGPTPNSSSAPLRKGK